MNKQALYYMTTNKGVECILCPFLCKISEGNVGVCKVRKNVGGELISLNYNKASALQLDPIEKKPLYHFYPGSKILSLGSYGCNFSCDNCQNWSIAKCNPTEFASAPEVPATSIIKKLKYESESLGLAYTYNEPTVFYEYMLDCAKAAKANGYKNVVVTNGYINQEPLAELNRYIDAYNVDLKGWPKGFYKKYLKAKRSVVLDNLIKIVSDGIHLEITHLLIPGLSGGTNDLKSMVKWIAKNLGDETVLHISKYFPKHKLDIEETSESELLKAYEIAKERLKYVYLGNVMLPDVSNTYCPDCKSKVVVRSGYHTRLSALSDDGKCKVCGFKVMHHLQHT